MGPNMGPWAHFWAHGPGIWARGPKLWAQFRARMVGPTSGPNLGTRFWGSNSPSLPFGKYPIPRAREAHIQVRRPLLCRRVLKRDHSATRLGLPRGDIVFFRPNHPNLGGGILGILAWRGLAWVWRGLAWVWRGLAWFWRGLAWVWRGLAWVWRGLAGYGVTWLGTRSGP